jgi:hypothetical protein
VHYDYQGIGVARAVYSLTPEALTVELPGPQLGKSLHEARIPVASIEGFYVEAPVRLRGSARAVAFNAMQDAARLGGGQLLISWTDGTKRRSKRFMMLNATAPRFQALVNELARLRPASDLRALPPNVALRRLGLWTPQMQSLAFIAGVIAILLVYMLVFVHQTPR